MRFRGEVRRKEWLSLEGKMNEVYLGRANTLNETVVIVSYLKFLLLE